MDIGQFTTADNEIFFIYNVCIETNIIIVNVLVLALFVLAIQFVLIITEYEWRLILEKRVISLIVVV